MTKVDVEEYFFNPNLGGKTYNHTWTGSVHLISPNYVNPWQAAYYGVYDMKQEWLSCIVGSLKIQF